jgi:hypothetical protein
MFLLLSLFDLICTLSKGVLHLGFVILGLLFNLFNISLSMIMVSSVEMPLLYEICLLLREELVTCDIFIGLFAELLIDREFECAWLKY